MCNAENVEDAELHAINFCCAEDAQICAYKITCCVGNHIWHTYIIINDNSNVLGDLASLTIMQSQLLQQSLLGGWAF